MEELEQFVGKNYCEVDQVIKELVKDKQVFPWPDGIGLVSREGNSIVAIIKSDLDDVILRFENG